MCGHSEDAANMAEMIVWLVLAGLFEAVREIDVWGWTDSWLHRIWLPVTAPSISLLVLSTYILVTKLSLENTFCMLHS